MSFQNFQPVKINNPDNPDHGRAGTVRDSAPQDVATGAGMVSSHLVQLDGDGEPRFQPAADLQAL